MLKKQDNAPLQCGGRREKLKRSTTRFTRLRRAFGHGTDWHGLLNWGNPNESGCKQGAEAQRGLVQPTIGTSATSPGATPRQADSGVSYVRKWPGESPRGSRNKYGVPNGTKLWGIVVKRSACLPGKSAYSLRVSRTITALCIKL